MAEVVTRGTKSFQVPEYFNFADVIDEWAQKEKPVNFEASRDKNCHGNMKMALKKLDNRPLHYLTRLVLTASIYTNFMSDFEQTIQQSYHDHFLLQKIWERKTITETVFNDGKRQNNHPALWWIDGAGNEVKWSYQDAVLNSKKFGYGAQTSLSIANPHGEPNNVNEGTSPTKND